MKPTARTVRLPVVSLGASDGIRLNAKRPGNSITRAALFLAAFTIEMFGRARLIPRGLFVQHLEPLFL
jgi:hypothetical protein